MAATPEQRYSEVAALQADVIAYLEGRLLQAAHYSRVQRATRWIWKRRRGLLAGGLLIAAVVGGGLALWQRTKARSAAVRRKRAEAHAAEERTKRQIQERIAPLIATMQSARSHLYIQKIDIEPHLQKVREALRSLEQLVGQASFRNRPELWAAIGKGRFFLDDLKGAETALVQVASSAEHREQVAGLLGQIYLRQAQSANLAHDRRRAARCLKQAGHWLAQAGRSESALHLELLRVNTVRCAGQLQQASRMSRTVLRGHKDELGSEAFQMVIAWSHLRHRKDQANQLVIRYCGAALQRRPHRFARAYLLRGHAWYHQGALDKALADLDQAIQANPKDSDAYALRGFVQTARGEFEQSIADLTRAIGLNSDNALAYVNRGVARAKRGDPAGAIADYEQAIKIEPRQAKAWNNRGLVRRSEGDLDGALADMTQAIKIKPRYDRAYNNRGRVREAKGDPDGAIADTTHMRSSSTRKTCPR